jgi:hypothetical protein
MARTCSWPAVMRQIDKLRVQGSLNVARQADEVRVQGSLNVMRQIDKARA